MAPTPNFLMPWPTTTCRVWLAKTEERDAYGNEYVTYDDDPDWEGECLYWPGRARTLYGTDDIEEGRPYGADVRLTVYLPKTFAHNPRKARVAVYPDDDAVISGHVYTVIGEPMSAPRALVPGQYSWQIEAGDHVG